MTVHELARVMCLVSGIFGRPAWDQAKCEERARHVDEAASRYSVDRLLVVAVDVYECDMRDRDAPIYEETRRGRKLVGYDACPMGVRVRDLAERRRLSPRDLYDRGAALLSRRRRGGLGLAGYNPGNPAYVYQVLAIRAAIVGTRPRWLDALTPRTAEIVRRIRAVAELRP